MPAPIIFPEHPGHMSGYGHMLFAFTDIARYCFSFHWPLKLAFVDYSVLQCPKASWVANGQPEAIVMNLFLGAV